MEVEFLLIKDSQEMSGLHGLKWQQARFLSFYDILCETSTATVILCEVTELLFKTSFSELFVLREASSLEANRKFAWIIDSAANHPQMWTTPPLAGYMNCIWKDMKQE